MNVNSVHPGGIVPAHYASESTRVSAPPGALAWTPDWGWILDELDLRQARANNEPVYDVDDDGLVHDAGGTASLTALMRIDRELHVLTMQIGDLIERLSNALEPLPSSRDRARVVDAD